MYVASVVLVLSVALYFFITALHLVMSSCCSKMICMDGHTSVMDCLISFQIVYLDWSKVSSINNSLSKFEILCPNLWDFCISSIYRVSFLIFCVSKFLNLSRCFSFSCFFVANSYAIFAGSSVFDVDSIFVDDELGSLPETTIGSGVTRSWQAGLLLSL